ncbi:site-specific integrase [Sulfuricurvum sp.]|uniref:tyrosine-type recombinase/integrase n=1 Tax=Sulfuricurvum sp. TaxID=2025608 RepID=UPI00261CB36C|nr:site-specific integrase [Sulfuricurvum sp.]MDD2838445.1 tyrosine-type recombinase/integrase [Sulfuricurvum sp.]MDD3597398.1 tyrosine-type recombinase/integrase [Sulfuricurvum sp.]
MNNNYKCQFGDLVFTIRDVKGIWKLDFTWDGKRQRPSMEMKATSENLETIRNEILPDLYMELTGRKVDPIALKIQAPTSPIFADFAERSIELQKNDVEGHVLQAKQQILERDILPYFGSRKINSILPSEIKAWQNELAKRLSIGSIQKYRGVLNHIFDDAWREGKVSENPVLKVKLPKKANPKVFRTEMLPFSDNEIDLILKNAKGQFRWFLQFSIFSGIRPGEAVALDWSDICFDTKTIDISKTTKRSGKGGYIIGKPKTEASIRKIDMLPQAEEALRAQFLETGLKNQKVFLNRWGKAWHSPDFLNLRFKLHLKQVGVTKRNLYNTRHTFASQMLAKKIEIGWISKTMGHENIQITLQTYTKYVPKDSDDRDKFLKGFVTLFVTPKDKMA